jgi:hypothetical protein
MMPKDICPANMHAVVGELAGFDGSVDLFTVPRPAAGIHGSFG